MVLFMGLLAPFSILFGIIEHRLKFLWIFILLFIHIGGVADGIADIALLWKIMIMVVFKQRNEDWDKLEGEESDLLLARILMTIGSAVPGVFMIFISMSGVVDEIETGQKPKNETSYYGSGMIGLFVMLIFWKVLIGVGLRVIVVIYILFLLIKYRKIDKTQRGNIVFMESILVLDLIWSGLPLGVLTGLQMFYYDLHFSVEWGWELVKLCGVIIDTIGASYLMYFIIFGLSERCINNKHDDQEEESSLLKPEETNV